MTIHLDLCPFCGGKSEFIRKKDGQLMIVHYPPSGVVCPARWEAVCDSEEQGAIWWNSRCKPIEHDYMGGP
jgi:hypothetical protein